MTDWSFRLSKASPLRIGMITLMTSAIASPPATAAGRRDQPAASVTAAQPVNVALVSAQPHAIPAEIHGSGRLLTHTMPAINGGATRATTLLFTPSGGPPAGGWPIVGWIHGTTSTGKKDCAPSLSPQLDGGLTRDGFKSGYVAEIVSLVNAGYAVVAPDLEGLGPVASEPCPYFSEASMARSVIAGVLAATPPQVAHG